jgi:hypothetical protein
MATPSIPDKLNPQTSFDLWCEVATYNAADMEPVHLSLTLCPKGDHRYKYLKRHTTQLLQAFHNHGIRSIHNLAKVKELPYNKLTGVVRKEVSFYQKIYNQFSDAMKLAMELAMKKADSSLEKVPEIVKVTSEHFRWITATWLCYNFSLPEFMPYLPWVNQNMPVSEKIPSHEVLSWQNQKAQFIKGIGYKHSGLLMRKMSMIARYEFLLENGYHFPQETLQARLDFVVEEKQKVQTWFNERSFVLIGATKQFIYTLPDELVQRPVRKIIAWVSSLIFLPHGFTGKACTEARFEHARLVEWPEGFDMTSMKHLNISNTSLSLPEGNYPNLEFLNISNNRSVLSQSFNAPKLNELHCKNTKSPIPKGINPNLFLLSCDFFRDSNSIEKLQERFQQADIMKL